MNIRETMTPRQRVTEALCHRQPDRMPIDLGMYTASGISAFAYWDLREYLGLPLNEVELCECVQVLPWVQEDILKRLHCDCILLNPGKADLPVWNPRGKYRFHVPEGFSPERDQRGGWTVRKNGQTMRMPPDGYFFDGDWITFSDLWEEPVFSAYMREAERIEKETDYFTAFKGFSPFYSQDVEYFCRMITEPEKLAEENAQLLARQLERAGRLIRESRGRIGAVCLSGDLGCQTAPMCRPESFERVVLPFLKEFCGFFHRNSDMKVFLHSCGAIEPLIPLLIEAGVDILNPVQISAAGMEPRALKRKYGGKIAFWGGGVDTQRVLGFQPEKAVRENVRECVAAFKPGGGYVFAPVHNIMGNISPQDILAVYDEAYRSSFYPARG